MDDSNISNPQNHNVNPVEVPHLVNGRGGTRQYSLAALVEKVEAEFYAEYGEDSAEIREADTSARQLRLIVDVVNYVAALESIQLDADDKAHVIQRAFSNLFGYGVLDALLMDERITHIVLDGASKVSVGYGQSELVLIGTLFDDDAHLKRIINRILADAGVDPTTQAPIIETGLTVAERPVRLSVVMPVYSNAMSVDIRLHSKQSLTLDDLVSSDFMSADAAEMLKNIAASDYGFCVVGEGGAGKTTLLNAILAHVPQNALTVVERAAELRLTNQAQHFITKWASEAQAELSFGQQILNALVTDPRVMVLDEVRADEPRTIAPLLDLDNPPRLVWSVRGAPDAKRLQSALGMLARRATSSESSVHTLYERLPFIITVAKIRDPQNKETSLKLFSIAEWQSRVDTDYPDYVMLMQYSDGAARRTKNTFARWIE